MNAITLAWLPDRFGLSRGPWLVRSGAEGVAGPTVLARPDHDGPDLATLAAVLSMGNPRHGPSGVAFAPVAGVTLNEPELPQ